MKDRKRDPGSVVSSSKSNISRALRGRIPKNPNFLALRNQQQEKITIPHSEQSTFSQPTTSAAPAVTTTQAKRSSDRNFRSLSYYGFDNSSSDSTTAAPNVRVESYQPPPASIVETVQHIAEQQPGETNISPIIGEVSSTAPQAPSILDQDTPTLVRSMTVFAAENQDTMDERISN